MLAVPTCDENARLPKLATVVSPLASTARIVLVSNSRSTPSRAHAMHDVDAVVDADADEQRQRDDVRVVERHADDAP